MSHIRALCVLLTVILAGATALPAVGQTELPIGKITRLQGAAEETLGGLPRALEAGSAVHAGGTVATGSAARLEIVFIDASQITLGADARIRLDELVYSAAGGSVAQAFQALDGAFRFLTGGVGRQDPEAVRVTTPVATIGIRGTEFFGGPLRTGAPEGRLRYGFLLLDGAIEVDSPDGRVTLDEVNEGTFLPLAGGAPPTEPQTWSQQAIDEALTAIRFE
jgi:hypothetical protein